ncbi:MAG: TrkH family potassium uptake protein [Gammaproteobacteria bacterium]|nr:MAG: TrkH family potassium uptake protein [Gammaproteobacteria bacterium]
MHVKVVQQILGLLLMLFSLSMLPPVFVSAWHQDGSAAAFVSGFLVTLLTGLAIWAPVRGKSRDLRTRDGFLVVAGFWTLLGLFGAAPLVFAEHPAMSLTDAVFEAVSGLTTTGATVLVGLDTLPPAILYYRAQLHWLGGMGIVVLAVAVLPMLGVGGAQLYRAETPGAVKDAKLTPRITETAKALWIVYLGLTIACTLAFWLAGMSLFDAICHSFATLATGGFSTHDASLGFFQSPLINGIAIVFMVLAGANFTLHFLVFQSRSLRNYWRDAEFKGYLGILGASSLFIATYLLVTGHYDDLPRALLDATFHVVSNMTTTGFTTTDFSVWPGTLPVMLVFIMFIGGCGGSTTGGIKVMRWLLLYRQGAREVARLIHPAAEIPVRLGGSVIPQRVVDAVWGFFAIYVTLFSVLMLILLATGVDQVTAFSAIATCINNVGPGLGDVVSNFTAINDVDKWVCVLAMLLGRLEIFTLFVLISPAFWRR